MLMQLLPLQLHWLEQLITGEFAFQHYHLPTDHRCVRDQWSVFVEGYSRVRLHCFSPVFSCLRLLSQTLSQMMEGRFKSIYPDLLGEKFRLRRFYSTTTSTSEFFATQLPSETEIMCRTESVIKSVTDAKNAIGEDLWQAGDMPYLRDLAKLVRDAICLSDYDRYHQLACFRSWLFWVELRAARNGLEDVVVTGLFYALLLAVVPIFPSRYICSISNVCRNRIQVTIDAIVLDLNWIEHAVFLTEVVSEWSISGGPE
jgi:hypothetical protein